MRRRALSAVAAASLAALVATGCTPGTDDSAQPAGGNGAAQADPAPVVTVLNDTVDEPTDSPSDADDADATAEPASDAVLIAAGEELALTVEGGEFTDVTLVDADHDTVPTDTGSFDGDDDSEDAADGEETAEPADAESTDAQALAGGTTDPTHGLVDVQDDAGDDSEPETAQATDGQKTPDEEPTGTSGADESADEPRGTAWASSTALVTGATYTWEASTVAPDGTEHTATGTVTTPDTTAQEELTANTLIADDQTVGVGAPIVVSFNSTIPEDVRAAIEARLSVEVTDADGEPVDVEGSWGWLYDTADGISRVHYRPKEFWPADVDVDVNLPLEGIEYSPRWYGKEDVDLSFEVGRDQRVVADAQSHRMTIERDGEQIADWPTSLGTPQAPSYNGTHVVMAKHEFYTMTSERWDYETDVSWAVRIHNNGEFIHAAPWSVGVQGSANVSHGCINLSTERAREYYDMALYGDPVEITGSSVDLSTEHSDISDWVYSWEDWQELSALD